jgi:hypothetical protein
MAVLPRWIVTLIGSAFRTRNVSPVLPMIRRLNGHATDLVPCIHSCACIPDNGAHAITKTDPTFCTSFPVLRPANIIGGSLLVLQVNTMLH